MFSKILGLATGVGLGLAILSTGMVVQAQASGSESIGTQCDQLIRSGAIGNTGDYVASDMAMCMERLKHQEMSSGMSASARASLHKSESAEQ